MRRKQRNNIVLYLLVAASIAVTGLLICLCKKKRIAEKYVKHGSSEENNMELDEDLPSWDNIKKIELSEKAKRRNKRFADFESFHGKAKEIFEPYRLIGEREKYFEALYKLSVCPGSRMGGHESRIVEFFWGSRLFDKNEGLSEDGRRSLHFESEAGVTMYFFKNDDGYVSIQMYPSHTEHHRPTEDFIYWRKKINPACLLDERFQKDCWKAFMAYMEVTSIDGAPTLRQKILVWCYRNFMHVVEDKKDLPLRYVSFLKKVGMWVLTVGFSGLVIFLLQMWLTPNPSEHQNIQDIRKSVVQTQQEIGNLQKEVTAIKEYQDSLIKVMINQRNKPN